MSIYYSASQNGFFDTGIHGARTKSVPDPKWKRPSRHVPDPDWSGDDESGVPLIEVFDEDAAHPMIDVANEDCRLPADAVEISDELHAALLAEQSQGKEIRAGANGLPEAAERVPDPQELRDMRLRERDALLAEADKLTQADRWESYSPERRAEIAAYKQALRDAPQQENFPAGPLPSLPA